MSLGHSNLDKAATSLVSLSYATTGEQRSQTGRGILTKSHRAASQRVDHAQRTVPTFCSSKSISRGAPNLARIVQRQSLNPANPSHHHCDCGNKSGSDAEISLVWGIIANFIRGDWSVASSRVKNCVRRPYHSTTDHARDEAWLQIGNGRTL